MSCALRWSRVSFEHNIFLLKERPYHHHPPPRPQSACRSAFIRLTASRTAMKIASSTATKCHLLSIPAELRLIIYKEVIADSPVSYGHLPSPYSEVPTSVGMLRLNRQIRSESGDVVRKSEHAVVHVSEGSKGPLLVLFERQKQLPHPTAYAISATTCFVKRLLTINLSFEAAAPAKNSNEPTVSIKGRWYHQGMVAELMMSFSNVRDAHMHIEFYRSWHSQNLACASALSTALSRVNRQIRS